MHSSRSRFVQPAVRLYESGGGGGGNHLPVARMALQRQYLLQSSPCRAPGCSQRAHIRLSATDKGADSTDDLIGRAFRSLFGKARDDRKPFGLQRLDPSGDLRAPPSLTQPSQLTFALSRSGPAFKSLYEASTSSEPAAAVEADTAEQALVRPLLTDTVLETATLRYKAAKQVHGVKHSVAYRRAAGWRTLRSETAGARSRSTPAWTTRGRPSC